MADAPAEVKFGKVTGYLVAFSADSEDAGDAPDQVGLNGKVTLIPSVRSVSFVDLDDPLRAFLETVECQLVDGRIYPPADVDQSGPPGVSIMASFQPSGSPSVIYWRAKFMLEGVERQPRDVTFLVPDGGEVNLAVVEPTTAAPGVVNVVIASATKQDVATLDVDVATAINTPGSASRAAVEDIAIGGSGGVTSTEFDDHINGAEPHPAYDDLASFTLTYLNGLI